MRTLLIKNQETTIANLVDIIRTKLELTSDGHPSQYITIKVEEETEEEFLSSLVKIRISNHSANRSNNDIPTLSFINETCNQGYSAMYGNEYVVDDLEDMNTNETNSRGWLSVEEVIDDFINDLKLS